MSVIAPLSLHSLSTMSKDNMLLGYARGKVGSLVFARRAGVQITRAYNANPANPRTAGQSAQRMLMATAIQAYRGMQSIVDHSFENAVGKAGNMRYFVSQALKDLRANHSNFSYQFYGDTKYHIGAYLVSSGSLAELANMQKAIDNGNLVFTMPDVTGGSSVSSAIDRRLGLENVGDIATIVFAYPSAVGGSGFSFVRITKIAETPAGALPAEGNADAWLKVEVPYGTRLAVPSIVWDGTSSPHITVTAAPMMYLTPGIQHVAMATISSHLRDGIWRRSNARLDFVNQGSDSYDVALATWPQNDTPVLNGGTV